LPDRQEFFNTQKRRVVSQHKPDNDPPQKGHKAVIPSEEARLVAAAKAGDASAFTVLVEWTQADVYTLAYRIVGNEDDARDVAQEAYLRAFRSLRRFRGDSRFSTWMFRITANCANDHLSNRSKSRHDELSEDDTVLDERPESDPEGMAEAMILRNRLTAALASLPPVLRVVIVLRDVYDLPHDAIATELGITESAAKIRLHRARRKLRERLFPDQKLTSSGTESTKVSEDLLNRLPAELAAVARLFLVDKLSHKEVAERLSIPIGTSYTRLRRARAILTQLGKDDNNRSEGSEKK
jgi:RNA polymerase sigma-70 factor, ECF subfamily